MLLIRGHDVVDPVLQFLSAVLFEPAQITLEIVVCRCMLLTGFILIECFDFVGRREESSDEIPCSALFSLLHSVFDLRT